MLRENNVEGIDIMQISGHTNVAFINNYSTFSEERHKKISNILNNTETNNVFTNAVKQYKAQL
jgi:23S rRNA U2552 (ribose-2'-O)-methylase RlmE/FtsJ